MPREPLDAEPSRTPTPTPARGPRAALHSDDLPIEQLGPVTDAADRDGDIILVDKDLKADPDYIAELAFMDEPVTIMLHPSSQENAPQHYPFWCNGRGAEVFQAGQWMTVTYLPVGQPLIIRRKILEIIARNKITTVRSGHLDAERDGVLSESRFNRLDRSTVAVCAFDLIEDRNPKGRAWLMEQRRRNF